MQARRWAGRTKYGSGVLCLAVLAFSCGDASESDTEDETSAGESTVVDNIETVELDTLADPPGVALHPALEVLEPRNGGGALFTGVIDVAAGEDLTLCTFTEGVTSERMYINNARGTQSEYGHHSVLFYLPEPVEPGTRDCGSMERFRSIQGGSGGKTPQSQDIPDGMVNEVPAGVQLMVQHHWINDGDETARVQGMMVYDLPSPDAELVVVRAVNVATRQWEVPPGQRLEAVTECEMKADVPVLATLAHLHEWGTWAKAEHVKANGDVDVLFDHAFFGDMHSNPRVFRYPLEDPLMFKAGDKARLTCTWENTTSEPLKYSVEMCVLNMAAKLDSEVYCLDDQWIELGGMD